MVMQIEKRIVIFKNNLEARAGQDASKLPDFRGNVTIDGVKHFISLWKHTKDGKNTLGGKTRIENTTEDNGDIVIWQSNADTKSLLTGVVSIDNKTYDFELYGRKSDKIGTYYEGQLKIKELVQENDTEELPF